MTPGGGTLLRFATGSMAGAKVGVYLILVRLTGRRLALSASATFLSVQHFGPRSPDKVRRVES